MSKKLEPPDLDVKGVSKVESDLRRDLAALEGRHCDTVYELRRTEEDLQAADLEVRNLTGVIEGLARVLANNINTKVRRSNLR